MGKIQLERVSERYPALGGIAGSGVRRVLGKPPLDALSVVIRESVQNSWDARLRTHGNEVRVLFRVRKLTDGQRNSLAGCLTDLPLKADIGPGLHDMFSNKKPVTVLEIADYGTLGLSGPESAEFSSVGGEPTHFVDFIRNIGKEHAEVDGGTYGFGKSSFYALSTVSTIYVDTRSTDMGQPVQRLMFAALGNRYEETINGVRLNFTGRHWWGRSQAVDEVSPVTALEAASLRQSLGLPERNGGDTGTTVGVLLPGFVAELNQEELVAEIRRIILANFWTKMVSDEQGENRINFQLEVDGESFEIPHPEHTSPFHLFVDALKAARAGNPEHQRTAAIRTGGRRIVHLGYAGYMLGPVSQRDPRLLEGPDRNWPDAAGGKLFRPDPVHHFAVMRSGELVVRYFEGRTLSNSQLEWAGVFITSGDPEVERAFATAEPPAHDDWNPQGMSGEPGRYVRAGLREINRAFDRFVTPDVPQSGFSASLGVPSSRLARLIPGLATQSGEAKRPGRSGRSGKKSSLGRFLPVAFEDFEEWGGAPTLVFRTEWSPGKDDAPVCRLSARPRILLDGSAAELNEVPDGLAVPVVLELCAEIDGFQQLSPDTARFETKNPFELVIRIQHVEDLAATVEVRYEQV